MKQIRTLNPEIEEIEPIEEDKTIGLEDEDIKKMVSEMSNNNISIQNPQGESSDSFFKHMAKQLYNKENVAAKTEYLNVNEVFVGSKLQYLSEFGGMPYLKEFVDVFEQKRISLERKGRKEIIMALQERRQEIEAERLKQLTQFNQGLGLQ